MELLMIRTAWDTVKRLRSGDFVVCIVNRKSNDQDETGKETLLAGVYQELNGEHVVVYFKKRKLTASIVTGEELTRSIIVGTKERTFTLRDTILEEYNKSRRKGAVNNLLTDLLYTKGETKETKAHSQRVSRREAPIGSGKLEFDTVPELLVGITKRK